MLSSVGFGDATVYFLHDGGVTTSQLNMRVLSIREGHGGELDEHVTIEGLVKREDSSPRSYSATGLMDKAVKVIYNPPETIAYWADGSKTVVKCDKDDQYDPKYGLALCYMKKALGSSRAFNDALRAGREDAVRDLLKKHRIVECVMAYDYLKGICPIEACPCDSCPYKDVEPNKCAELMHKDIKKMREGEKHD